MKCPIDNATLAITERQGIEIDYCPECRGVWLDRGELDKIISKSEPTPSTSTPVNDYRAEEKSHQRHDQGEMYGGNYKKKKRESFIGDLFDF